MLRVVTIFGYTQYLDYLCTWKLQTINNMKKYSIKTKFIFEGEFYIIADSKGQAKEYVRKHCGLVGDIHTTLPDEICDWEFNVHPDKIIK